MPAGWADRGAGFRSTPAPPLPSLPGGPGSGDVPFGGSLNAWSGGRDRSPGP
jgi:hypothetical protein